MVKYIFILISFNFGIPSNAQTHDVTSVAYTIKSKHYKDQSNYQSEMGNLLIKGNKSSFQTYNHKELDTIRLKRKNTDAEFNRYFSYNEYTIEISNDSLVFYDTFADNEYTYTEKLDFKWELTDEEKFIQGYSCKKAITEYGGRTWIAWYTLEIPLNAGPYKFKGLPGLILEVTDLTETYAFEFYGLAKRDYQNINKIYHLKSPDERIVMTRKTFNTLKSKFENMSLSEKINFGRSQNSVSLSVKKVDDESSPSLRNLNYGSSNYNMIEIDHLD